MTLFEPLHQLSVQEKDIMDAAARAFEDWEFRVLEQESGVEEVDGGMKKERDNGGEMQGEIVYQQHAVNNAQVRCQNSEVLLITHSHYNACFVALRWQ